MHMFREYIYSLLIEFFPTLALDDKSTTTAINNTKLSIDITSQLVVKPEEMQGNGVVSRKRRWGKTIKNHMGPLMSSSSSSSGCSSGTSSPPSSEDRPSKRIKCKNFHLLLSRKGTYR